MSASDRTGDKILSDFPPPDDWIPSSDDPDRSIQGENQDRSLPSIPQKVDTGLQRDAPSPFSAFLGEGTRFEGRIQKVRNIAQNKVRAFRDELTGKGARSPKSREMQIFDPVMIGIQEFIMLFSGLMLLAVFLIFVFFKDQWYENFSLINNIILLIFGGIAVSGFLILFFISSDTPRLQGSMRKKVVFSIIGLILLVGSSITLYQLRNEQGISTIVLGNIALFGLFFLIISSESMSSQEAIRFFFFFIGTLMLLMVPIHESMNVLTEGSFSQLPLSELNLALIVLGMSFTILGIYLLRERSGYFGVWLLGILIFALIPLHEIDQFNFINSESYQTFDQSIGIIGAFLLMSGYMMFFYRYRQFMVMSGSIFLGNRYFKEGRTVEADQQYWKAFWILEKMGNIMDYDVIWGNLGNIFTRRKDYNAALAYFEMGITINPTNDMLWNDKGNLFYLIEDHRKAIAAFKQGIALNDTDKYLYQNLGVAQSAIGLHEDAILNYDRAIALDPKYEKAWHNKGKSLHDLGDFDGALTAYDAALRLNQESPAWLDRGDVLYLLERFDEALKSYDRAIRSSSDNPEAWIHRGVCLYALQMYEKAITDFRKATELDDSLTVPYNLLGNAFAQLGDLLRAKQFYGIAIQKKSDYSRARFNLARTMAKLGEDALEAYESAVQVTARQRLNEVWFEEAIQYYNEILDGNPEDARAWKGRANLLLKIGKLNKAISSYRKAVEFEPTNPRTFNLLGIAQRKTQQLEDALSSFEQATLLDPKYFEAWNNKGNVLYLMGQFHHALQAYNQAIDLSPDYRSAIQNRHRCITQLKSDIQVESVPLKSTVEEYMTTIETYREQGYKVDILENLLQEGKPHVILSGFEDYKRRVGRLKIIEGELEELNIEDDMKERIRGILNDPALLSLILEVIDDAKRKRSRSAFEKLQRIGSRSD